MKKLFLSLVAAIVAATATYAQKDHVATLTHEGSVRTFYGINSLAEAHEAAVEGDVITLSSGFYSIERISKAVTIIGAGMEDNAELDVEKTTVGLANISIADETETPLKIKNIEFNGEIRIQNDPWNNVDLHNAIFTKCTFNSTYRTFYGGALINVTFVQCHLKVVSHHDNSDVSYVNCCIEDGSTGSDTSVSFLNCTITDFGYDPFDNCTFINCVLNKERDELGWADEDNVVDNCLGAHPGSREVWQRAKNSVLVHTNIFKEGTFYELTDEAKALITSNDGTEIGMYGGQYPYNPIPDGPRITKFNVASKSSADNKLSVDVEVSSAE